MLNEIENLVSEVQDGDRLVFFYSGDSIQLDLQYDASEDGIDEALIPIDGRHILDDELRLRLVDLLPAGVKLSAIFDSRSPVVAPLDLEHYTCNNVYVPWVDQYYASRRLEPWAGGPDPGMPRARTLEGHSDSPPNPSPRKPVSEHEPSPSPEADPYSSRILVYQPRRSSMPLMVDEELRREPGRLDSIVWLERSNSDSSKFLRSLQDPSEPRDSLGGIFSESPEPMYTQCDGWCEPDPAHGSGNVISLSGSLQADRFSFAQLLMDVLEEDVGRSYREVLHAVSHKMYIAERSSLGSRHRLGPQPLMRSSRPMDMERMSVL
ncbi:hypothetical protein K466DRAFT_655510 [Polyporus arcularius HHB13444]|uniref:Uncharacterized protein n=1 Tax=Polyporus arcularius HHB13444 TaxID=1314778 RepID=A0A5C3NZT5_9APHY|nr:hypothetical protein K466DRAFT_655510 [Polyporus arcularius HHB13444]